MSAAKQHMCVVFPAHGPTSMLDPVCWAPGAVWMGKEDEMTEVLDSL